MSIRVLAHHAHVFPESINPAGTPRRLLELLDACGIEQAVCFAPFPHQAAAVKLDRNRWLAEQVQEHKGRLLGFGTIDFSADIRLEVRKCVDLGFRGLKLHPNTQQFDILGSKAFELYAAAQEANLFLTFHTGMHHYRIKEYNVLGFDEVAWNFPALRFSMEHVGGYHFFPQALAVIVNNIPFPPVPGKRCRVFAGMTSIFTQHYNRFWYLDRSRIEELVAQAGPEQLIFGLDFPYNLEENTRIALDTLSSLGLCDSDRALVFGGNLRRELGLPAR